MNPMVILSPTIQWLFEDSFYKLFSSDLRPGLFTGFLTISGFLYSAHTFIVIHMKKELYDTDEYRKRMETARTVNPDISYYGALRRLSRLLISAVGVSLAASLSQVTIGLHHANWTAVVCVVMAIIAFGLLIWAVAVMALNLHDWFEGLENMEAEKAKKIKQNEAVRGSSLPNPSNPELG